MKNNLLDRARRYRGLALVLFSIGTALCAAACSDGMFKPGDYLFQRLKGRGPVLLSDDNPYLAGNLLLAHEVEESPELKGFLQHRGRPGAIEIDNGFFSPVTMRLYYLDRKEVYELEYTNRTWLITGPRKIAGEQWAKLSLTGKEPALPDFGLDVSRPKLPAAALEEQAAPSADRPIPEARQRRKNAETPVARAERQKRTGKDPAFSSPATGRPGARTGAIAEDSGEQSFYRRLAEKFGEQPAETTPKGDLVHYVTYPGESLSIIARWYTFDGANASRIANINRLPNPNALSLGDEIVIPAYMLKNQSRLSDKALQVLSGMTKN